MAYTHADGRTITMRMGEFQALASVAVKAGDLVYVAGSTGVALATQTTTASAKTTSAQFVACQDLAAAETGLFALAVEIQDPATISTSGGAVTIGALAVVGDVGVPLFLGTSGEATSTVPTAGSTVIKQYVGYVNAVDKIILAPYWNTLLPATA